MAEKVHGRRGEVTIVVDTNVIISALMTRGIVRELIINNPGAFITPDWCYQELHRHRNVWNRNELPEKEIEDIINDMKKYFIYPVEKEIYQGRIKDAEPVMVDHDDVPILATALSVENYGIWTFDVRHFDTKEIKQLVQIMTTNVVKTILENYLRK
ncbi:MAG: PIN domain-containing protein [Thermoplasmatota archaeon]